MVMNILTNPEPEVGYYSKQSDQKVNKIEWDALTCNPGTGRYLVGFLYISDAATELKLFSLESSSLPHCMHACLWYMSDVAIQIWSLKLKDISCINCEWKQSQYNVFLCKCSFITNCCNQQQSFVYNWPIFYEFTILRYKIHHIV